MSVGPLFCIRSCVGKTEDADLITLDRPSHNAKSAGLYEDALLDTGIVQITDPWGHVFNDPPDTPMNPAPPELLHPAPPDTEHPCPF